MAWCDAQLAGYTSAVQNDLEEMQEQTTPWIRVQVCASVHLPVCVSATAQREVAYGSLSGMLRYLPPEVCPAVTLGALVRRCCGRWSRRKGR